MTNSTGSHTSEQDANVNQIVIDQLHITVLPDGRMSRKNAALYLGVTPATLAKWFLLKKGPASKLMSGLRFYYRADLDAFIQGTAPEGGE